jgi:hypothetical protein
MITGIEPAKIRALSGVETSLGNTKMKNSKKTSTYSIANTPEAVGGNLKISGTDKLPRASSGHKKALG